MNYDSYLLWLAYFSSVTAELLAVGSGAGRETKRRIASMNIAFLGRKNKDVKKISLSNRILRICCKSCSFLSAKCHQGQKGTMFSEFVRVSLHTVAFSHENFKDSDGFYTFAKSPNKGHRVPAPAGSTLPTSSENFSANKAMIVCLLSYFRLYIVLLSFFPELCLWCC